MIEVKNVTKSYGNGHPAIKNLNMKIEDGEFVFVVGASGSGKSTFIKMLLRELKPTEGTIEINGEDIATIKVSSIDGDDSVKLYNGDIAKAFNKEFPKSFKEYHEFLDTYEYGSTITRYSSEENEAQ